MATISSAHSTPSSLPKVAPRPAATADSVRVSVMPAAELSGDLAHRWEQLRQSAPEFSTPFFSSRYTKLVGQLRPLARLAVFDNGNEPVAFLPFEFANRKVIEPIGKAFNDSHGLLCSPELKLDYCEALRQMGVKSYRFHALAGPLRGTESCIIGNSPSFLADLAAHPEGYVTFLEQTRATIFKQRRKTKKMVKDMGKLRLELDCRDPSALEALILLKRDQYQRSHIFDILGVEWSQEMLRQLWADPTQPCRGLLSVLYAGDTLVAAHYGMLEGNILHYWFPVYDMRFGQYSPGTAMFLEIANQAASLGIEKIDMGYGEQPYKHKFVDTITYMPYGCATACPLSLMREKMRISIAAKVKRLPGKPLLKKCLRTIWPSFGHGAYQ